MYIQLNKFANYGEGDYGIESYSYTTSTTAESSDSQTGLLPNTGQDILAITGLGLIIVAVSLFALIRRKKPNQLPKTDN